MTSDDNSGPAVQLSWNFPLLRVMTNRVSRVGTAVKSRSERPVRDRVLDSDEKDESEDDEELNGIRDRLSQIQSDDDDVEVSQGESTTIDVVRFTGDTFVPLRANIDIGDSLTWRNNSSEEVTINFNDGQSDTISPNGATQRQFNEEGVIEYSVEGQPIEDVCGAVLVGPDASIDNLVCEGEVERDLFEDDSGQSVDVSAPSSMSVAAEEKQEEKQ